MTMQMMLMGKRHSGYSAFLIRPKICCLLLNFRCKQQILGLIRKALYRGKDYGFNHCCQQRCLARIKDAERMYTIEPRLSFNDTHRAVVQSAISDENLPSVFAEIICSFLVILDRNVWWISEYNMFCHGAINEWFNTEAECQRAVQGELYGIEAEWALVNNIKWDRKRPIIIGLFGQPWEWDDMEGVGKSSLVQGFSSGTFFAENETKGVVTKVIKVRGIKPVRIEIHDSAERINTTYGGYRNWPDPDNIDVVLLCFAIHKRDTLDSCVALLGIAERRLVPFTKRYHGRAFVLVGCQMDRMYDPEPEDHAFDEEIQRNYTMVNVLRWTPKSIDFSNICHVSTLLGNCKSTEMTSNFSLASLASTSLLCQ